MQPGKIHNYITRARDVYILTVINVYVSDNTSCIKEHTYNFFLNLTNKNAQKIYDKRMYAQRKA